MIFVLLMDFEGSGFGNYSGCITRAQDIRMNDFRHDLKDLALGIIPGS